MNINQKAHKMKYISHKILLLSLGLTAVGVGDEPRPTPRQTREIGHSSEQVQNRPSRMAWRKAINDPVAARLAKPTLAQYNYQELDRTMFIHFSTNTGTNREYDLGGIPASSFNPTKLDTEQWCQAAKNMGAKAIVFVAKHVGGFCLWQTTTTDYSIKSSPWKNGKGDILDELAKSCKKNDLDLGVYIYPGDMRWGSNIGSGGITKDPSKQEAYNKVLRTQWTECLTKYGKINELWFDGSCKVELKDIILKYAPNSVIFQGPMASIRWPGSESGMIPYPAWNSLSKADLASGVATVKHGNPDGGAWAPLESNTTLYDHNWFWSKKNESKRKSLKHLVKTYYHSVGRGSLQLLNSTPNTDGLIPKDDMKRYKEYGDEIKRRFSNPLAVTKGLGKTHTLTFSKPTLVNQVLLMEDYRYGERIRAFILEAKVAQGQWVKINTGSAVGRKRIIVFKERPITALRLTITKNVGTPLLRSFKAYFVKDIGYEYLLDVPKPISMGKPATASHTHSAPFGALKINDGNLKTRWSSTDHGTSCWVEIDFQKSAYINQVSLRELKNRVNGFQIEYRRTKTESWKVALEGEKIGTHFEASFPTVYGRYFRLNILNSKKGASLWEFNLTEAQYPSFVFHTLKSSDFINNEVNLRLDISKYFTKPGEYKIAIQTGSDSALQVLHFEALYNNRTILKEFYQTIEKDRLFSINRTAQIVEGSKIEVKLQLRGKVNEAKFIIFPPSY